MINRRRSSSKVWPGEVVLGPAKAALRTAIPEPLYRRYRQIRVHHLVSSFKTRVVEHRYAGFPLKVSLEDPLGEGWYDHGWEEPPEVSALRERGLTTGARVFDLGAHQGIVALILARIVGDEGLVIAVEADPHNADVAKRNVLLNEAGNTLVVSAAVADTPGDALFAEGLNGRLMPGREWGKIRVPAVTVDQLAAEHGHPDVLLIDIEGAEAKALAGAKKTIKRGATFLIEVHVGCGLEDLGARPADVIAAFNGYELLCMEPGDPVWRELTAELTTRSFLLASPA
jgi:FkbM family methyltransferase